MIIFFHDRTRNYCTIFQQTSIVNQIHEGCNEPVNDCKIVAKMLRTLIPQFDHVAVAIEEYKNLEGMSIEELQNSLEVHKQRC